MGVLLAASMFAQLSCAPMDTGDMVVPIGSTFASSALLSEEAGSLQPEAADGSREDVEMAAEHLEWVHPFLEMLHYKLQRAYQEIERIKKYNISIANVVPLILTNDSDNPWLKEGIIDNNPSKDKISKAYSINERDMAVFDELLHAGLDDLCGSYADLLRVDGAKCIAKMCASAGRIALFSAWAPTTKILPNGNSVVCTDYDNPPRADASGAVTPLWFRSNLVRLFEECKTFCNLGWTYRNRCSRMSNSIMQRGIDEGLRVWKSEGVEAREASLTEWFGVILSRLEYEMKELVTLNTEISKHQQNMERVTAND
ncbi:hypothetical protein PAPHI01_2329 [Pancytospora philotis]|nr:hypothetical protein PAPHI01_2329 [Pancytospora philotis]